MMNMRYPGRIVTPCLLSINHPDTWIMVRYFFVVNLFDQSDIKCIRSFFEFFTRY